MIKLQNKHLKIIGDFLQNTVTAKGKKNIHRMRIVKALDARNKEVAEEEFLLLKEYAKVDEDGNPIPNKKGGFDFQDTKGFSVAYKALFEEIFVIDDKNLETALNTVKKLVNDFDKELSGNDAEAHFILSEAFEENNSEEEIE